MTDAVRAVESADQPTTRRAWVGLAVLSLATVVYAMDFTILHLAVPAITADLQPTATELLWILDVYGLVVAATLILMGVLGDRYGRRRLLHDGAAGFAICSILAALATTPSQLIAARAALGLAGATIAPATLSLLFALFTAAPAGHRDWDLGGQLLRRFGGWSTAGRSGAGALLVGVGVAPRCPGDGDARRARSADPPRAARRRGRATRSARRRSPARDGPRGRRRAQGACRAP
ncbi:MAG: MFS transporter [Euzebya tangerina]|nr:MFS transporter [Euzebya tangerina]